MELLTLYTHLLNAAQMSADAQGVIHRQFTGVDDKKMPVIASLPNDKKALMVMPIKQQTADPDWSARIAFHPLREVTQRGESVVMEKYRTVMIARINVTALTMINKLIYLAAHAENQSALTPDQLGYLAKLPDVDKTTAKQINALLEKLPPAQSSPLWIFIKHGGVKDGVVYRRMASVTAPLLDAVNEAKDRKVGGVQLRISDVKTINALYDIIFPMHKQGDLAAYNAGSNSVRAPTIDAFMKCIRTIAENLNDLIYHFKDVIGSDADDMMFDMKWIDAFEDIDALTPQILLIPSLPGNEGRILNAKVESAVQETPPWEAATTAPSDIMPRTTEQMSYQPRRAAEPLYRDEIDERRRDDRPAPTKAGDGKLSLFEEIRLREKQGSAPRRRETRSAYDDPYAANGYESDDRYRDRRDDRYDDRRRGYDDRRRDDRYDDRRDDRGRGYRTY